MFWKKKGEYYLSANVYELSFRNDFYLGSTGDGDERKTHYILTTGISFISIDANLENKFIQNSFWEMPIMLKMEYDYGDISIKNSIGLYASALEHASIKNEKQKIIYKEDFPGYNFGIILSLFGISYKFTETKAVSLDFILRTDLAQAYYKGNKVIRMTRSFNLGFEI